MEAVLTVGDMKGLSTHVFVYVSWACWESCGLWVASCWTSEIMPVSPFPPHVSHLMLNASLKNSTVITV